ncbi:DUF4339 domain-containing protein [Chitinophagaceae bacterium LB-8]|uniref:DUF4339 domain-containing protein n=1 Tax=Paraflavisolibacter caeni TaxID=2982496 RepID=A0A9X2XZ83_9BACT|nr:hypothetical protein [Paraflavisolibacter caeni]MCU7551940.1 DUF4339 domain-containing protein [Paraflavisolibacter caeni]
MQKGYLLLRDNHQSGPFSLEELLQHELKTTDLVWEEGRSAGWSFPYEIASLKPFLHLEAPPVQKEKEVKRDDAPHQEILASDMDAPFASKSVTSKNVYVSLPDHHLHREEHQHEHLEETLEQKAEAIRKRAFAALEHGSSTENRTLKPESMLFDTPYELETKVARTTSEIGEDYSAWLYTKQIQKKKKARRRKSILTGVSVVFLISLGIIFYKGVLINNYEDIVGAKPTLELKKDDVAQGNVQPQNLSRSLTNEPTSGLATGPNTDTSMVPGSIEKAKVNSKQAHNNHSLKPIETISNSIAKDDSNHETTPVESLDTAQIINDKVTEDVAAESKKKEKSGGKKNGFFGRLFGSRDRTENNEVKTEETNTAQAPVESVPKRKSETSHTATNITNFISVSSNVPAESLWMLGVQGLKLTLTNKSNETVKTATVEVRYYNEDKDLLEKKVVYFNNVSPKSSQTVAAPDHRLAERTDYQLVSAVPKEDGYVRQ